MGSSDGLGRSHPVRSTPQMDRGIGTSLQLKLHRVFSRLLGEPDKTNTLKTLHPLSPRTSGTPLFACLGLSKKIIGHDLSRPERSPRDSKHKRSETCRNGTSVMFDPVQLRRTVWKPSLLRSWSTNPTFAESQSRKLHASKAERHCPHSLATTFTTSA